jgi:MFS family permease
MTMTTTPGAPTAERTRVINRWWYVAAGFIALLVGVNTMNILFNVLTPSLTAEFGWDRLQISSGLSIFTVFDGLSLLALGFLLDKYGIRKVATPMVAVFGLGIVALSFLPGSLAVLYILCAVIGCGAGAATATVYSVVVTAWFGNSRGLALGILNVGLGLCGTLMPFVIGGLLGVLGWRGVFVAIGVLCAALPVLVYLFVIRMPADWEAERAAANAQGRMAGVPLRTIIRTRHFWLICVAIFLVSAATFGILSQVVAITTDRGVDTAIALSVLSTVSLSSIGSRFVVGFLLDRIWAPLLTAIIFVLCGVGVAVLTMSTAVPLLFLGAVLVGLGLGAEGDIAAYIVSRYVPKHSYARVFGIVMFLYAQGGAVGIFILSFSFTNFGSYDPAVWLIVAMVLASAAAVLALGRYKFRVDGTPSAGVDDVVTESVARNGDR